MLDKIEAKNMAQHLNDIADELELSVSLAVGAIRFEAAQIGGDAEAQDKENLEHLKNAYNAVRLYNDHLDEMDVDLDYIEAVMKKSKKKPN